MADDTGNPAVDEKGNQIVEEVVFSPKQEQFISGLLDKQADKLTSHFGRISKEQVNKQIDPEKLNEDLSTKFLTNVEGTFNELMDKREVKNKKVKKEKLDLITMEMEKFSDQPLFEETKEEIQKIAELAITEKGFPPGPAVEFAIEKAGKAYLQHRDPDYNLEMSGPGKVIKRTKEKKMPEALKAAADRDIKSGIFKDEADYIKHLSPEVKDRYGL